MDNKKIAERLKGFEAVWKRVGAARADPVSAAGSAGVRLMPGKNDRNRGMRHSPGRR